MECETLVVGGGPAGSTAARLLTEHGIETILVEKNFSFDKPCGGGVPSAGLKDINILDEIQNNVPFNKVTKIKVVPPFSEPIEVCLQGGEILVFPRLEFDSFLRKFAEKKGAKIIEAELVNIEVQNKKISSTIKKKSGEILKINSKYLIASDGVNSKVCSLLRLSKPQYYWTVSVHLPENFEKKDTCEFWFSSLYASFLYSWVFPGSNYLSVGTGSPDPRELKKLLESFIKKRFRYLLNDWKTFKLRAYKIPKWSKRDFLKGNILFCGDALGTVMPVSFEGIYYAMKSAQFASEAIIQKSLKIYEKLWNERFLNQFKMMKKFHDFLFVKDEKMDKWLNLHRSSSVQELAMALWLKKEHGRKFIPLYLKAFGSVISRAAQFKLK